MSMESQMKVIRNKKKVFKNDFQIHQKYVSKLAEIFKQDWKGKLSGIMQWAGSFS